MPRKGIVAAMRRSTAPRQYWHADTIPLAPNWQKAKHALILVDDFTRQCFVKLLKDKTQFHVAEALNEHFTHQRPFSTGVKGVNFYVRNTALIVDLNLLTYQSWMYALATDASQNILALGSWANTKTVSWSAKLRRLDGWHVP
jgi:hypothetical protein